MIQKMWLPRPWSEQGGQYLADDIHEVSQSRGQTRQGQNQAGDIADALSRPAL